MARILIGNIKGPQGAVGPQGSTGPQGPVGPQGPMPPLVNNGLTTEAGVAALDAAYGKILIDMIGNVADLPGGSADIVSALVAQNSNLDKIRVIKTIVNVSNGVARYTDPSITSQTRIMVIRSGVNSVSTNFIANITSYNGYCDMYFNNTVVSRSEIILMIDER